MKSTRFLFHVRYLPSSSTRHLLHTCLPLMNKEKSSDKKDANKSDGSQEQPHMRIEAKALAGDKSMY